MKKANNLLNKSSSLIVKKIVDYKKRQIFHILLTGGLYLVGISFLLNLINLIIISVYKNQPFDGISPILLLTIWLGIFSLIWISKNHETKIASHLFLSLLWLPAAYTSLRWGALFYQAIIIFILVIVLSGILLNTRSALIITLFTNSFLIGLTHLQHQALLPLDNGWKIENEDIFNAITVSISLLVIFLVSWLYNRELHQVLKKVILSEKSLEKEKRLLKKRVREQTQQIQLAQAEKMIQWQQFVEVGRSAVKIFHDIKNPLTSASLNLEQLCNNKSLSKSKLKKIKLAFESIQFIGKFINSTQLQLSNQHLIVKFSPAKHIKQAVQIMSPKAVLNHVDIIIRELDSSLVSGPANKFTQVVINLISNAIDSYHQIERKQNQQIIIDFNKNQKKFVLKIQDFGEGILAKNKQKIFEPMYSTKNPNMGIGLGLTITKNTIENDFKGTITYNSIANKGTTFVVTIPISISSTRNKFA